MADEEEPRKDRARTASLRRWQEGARGSRTAGDAAGERLARSLAADPLARDRKGRVGDGGRADRDAARSFLPTSPEAAPMSEREQRDRTESGEPERAGKRHVPYAQMDERAQKEKAPGKDAHEAGGQGLSG